MTVRTASDLGIPETFNVAAYFVDRNVAEGRGHEHCDNPNRASLHRSTGHRQPRCDARREVGVAGLVHGGELPGSTGRTIS